MAFQLKAWSENQQHQHMWELIRDAELQAPVQTHEIRICVLKRPPGGMYKKHSSMRSRILVRKHN